MAYLEKKICRFTFSQLKVLYALSQSPSQLLSSHNISTQVGLEGKELGAILSSLSRVSIMGKNLILPCGRVRRSDGLNWKLNTDLISAEKVRKLTESLIQYS